MIKIVKKAARLLPDEIFIKVKYYYHFHKFPNLKNPRTFNEKLQWLKLYDRKPIYTTMVDKYEVKKYVSDLIGEDYIVQSYGVWEHFDEIDFDSLPDQFVLKTTHDCGGVVICNDKESFDKQNAKEFLERHLKFNYFYEGREWPYKNVKPRIIAEQYMEDSAISELRDYKFSAFNGVAKAVFIASERQLEGDGTKFEKKFKSLEVYKVFNFNGEPYMIQAIQNDKTENETIDYFDMSWKKLNLKQNYPNSEVPLPKPQCLEEIEDLARKMSQGFPFIRTDFYIINDRPYFSEYTFYSDSGFAKFEPEEWDRILGDLILLAGMKVDIGGV